MKKLLVILDGIGDLPHPLLKGKTPLQAAHAPTLQKLARNGKVGLQRPARQIAPESDVGVCSVLGHNPFKEHVGRGLLEAKGANMRFRTGNLALRANFATCVEDGVTLIDRRVGRSLREEDARALAKGINKQVKLTNASFEFKATKGHRGVLVIHAREALNDQITNTDPAYEVIDGLGSAKQIFEMKITPAKAWKRGTEESARLVNEFTRKSFEVLSVSEVNQKRKMKGLLPANCLLLRDAESEDKKFEPLPGRWAILSEMPMEEGIGQLKGMRVVRLEKKTGMKEQYAHVVAQTCKTLLECDGAYVHLKGPDVFGHDGDARGKMKSIEEIDAFFFKPLLEKIDLTKTRILITADHATPCVKKAHSADPVPFLLAGAGITAEGPAFDENAPGLVVDAWELMPRLLKE